MVEGINALIGDALSMLDALQGGINVAAPAGLLFFGLLTGLRHSMEADHIAAVLSLVASDRKKVRRASLLGAMWGLGHTASLFAAGLVVLLLAVNIPASISSKMEFGVGVMLLFLAVSAFTGLNTGRFLRALPGLSRSGQKHSHEHVHYHENGPHSHVHAHTDGQHAHAHKSLIVGMVHGMAGSGALMLVVLSTINSIPLGLAYIAIFGAGSIASMIGTSTLMGIPFARLASSAKLGLILRYAAASTTLAVGAGLIYNLVWVDRIFMQ